MIKKVADIAFAFRFLRMLVMKWEDTDAYKLGLVDGSGRKLKKPESIEEKNAYTVFIRLVFNLKRLLEKLPGSRIASYASALYLIKEHTGLTEEQLIDMLDQLEIQFELDEEKKEETPVGLYERYQLHAPILVNENVFDKGTSVVIIEDIGVHFGARLYKAEHILSGKTIVVSEEDLGNKLSCLEEFSVTTANVETIPSPLKTDLGDKYQRFKLPSDVFRRFDRGRKKYSKWKMYLDLNDEKQATIANFARKHRDALVVIEDETTGALRAIRPQCVDGH